MDQAETIGAAGLLWLRDYGAEPSPLPLRGGRVLVRDPAHRPVPQGVFLFVADVIRWNDRVIGYARNFLTEEYPLFRPDL